MARAKNWCFTVNNYTADDYASFITVDPRGESEPTPAPGIVYAIVGKEVGASGTPHLQGFVSFVDRKRLPQCRQVCARAHWSVARHLGPSIEYCRKDGDFVEVGDRPPPVTQGKRNDIEDFKLAVGSGTTCRKTLREEHSIVWAKYPRFCETYLRDAAPRPNFVAHTLRDWQQEVVAYVSQNPDPREIYFVVDINGNGGKSYLSQHLEETHSRKVQALKPGKIADMSYEYAEDTEILILDCPRSKQGEYIQYDFLESIKDGRLFSPKYESRMKRFNPPHVLVFMNEFPDMEKLSQDRYKIVEI